MPADQLLNNSKSTPGITVLATMREWPKRLPMVSMGNEKVNHK